MNPNHLSSDMAARSIVFVVLVASMYAQETVAPQHTGVPQDWSRSHIIFSRDALAQHPEMMNQEPRILHQAMQRWQAPDWGTFQADNAQPARKKDHSSLNRDWNVATLGGRLRLDMFAAKFSFDPAAPPDCVKDFVVFGLGLPGVTGAQANLVGFNNLYVNDTNTGFCPGTAPNVLFAYNITSVTGGRILTSPILSLDGSKIGFVESVPGATPSSVFHVLTWTAGQGAIGAAAAPTMTSVTLSATASDSTSSPWVDYANGIVYVGADNGNVYKITRVFTPTPLRSGSPWPVTLASNYRLTAPVLDFSRNVLMVGSNNGNLYQVDTTNGAVATAPVGGGGTSSGIITPPIVDPTNGTTFVVDANSGAGGSAVLAEFDTATLLPMSVVNIGIGATTGTKVRLLQPAVTNAYYTDPSTGAIVVCGTGAVDTRPWEYSFGFLGRRMLGVPTISQQLSTNITTGCTGLTEFFNPSVGVNPGGTDFFFFGLTGDCTLLGGAGASTTGCVVSDGNNAGTTTITTALVNGGPSGIIVDNYSSAAQASSIYLTSLLTNIAYKFTQEGLQ